MSGSAACGAAARAEGMRARASKASKSRSGAQTMPSLGRGGQPREPSRRSSAHEEKQPAEGEQAPVKLVDRRRALQAARGARSCGCAATARRGGSHDRLRLRDGLRLRDRLRLRRRLLRRLGARDRRGAAHDRRRRGASTGALRTGAGCVRVTGGGSGATASGGRSGAGVAACARHGEDDAQQRETSCRSAPTSQQRPSPPSCHFPPISGPFSRSYCGFRDMSTRRLAPQAGPVPTCGATPFVYSARDLPVAFFAASWSAADRPSANWPFFAD